MIYVLYHGNCYDGFGAAWAAWKALGDGLRDLGPKYIPVTHGRPMPEMEDGARVYILDFSYPRTDLIALAERMQKVTVLDHHKTAEEDLRGLSAPKLSVTFDMEKSGAILTWEHFFSGPAPDLLRYIEDRDLWRFRLHESEEVAAAMRSWPFKFDVWDRLKIGQLASEGAAILRQTKQMVQMICSQAAMGDVGGERAVVVNSTAFWSEVGHRLLEEWPESPFAASWYIDKHGDRIWSLRGRGDYDVSALAKRNGGGGHRDAAGFTERPGRLATSGAAPAAQQEIRDFEAHLREIGMPVQIATRAVVNRAREVAAIAPKGQKADRDDYTTLVSCGPLYRLAEAVREMQRQEDILRGRAPYKPAAPTGDSK